jgi:hypothetical protein
MLYDKACAIALINRIQSNGPLYIEDQYTKSDYIFYKFKGSNIAVTKKLNHLDLSILSEEDLNYLLDTVTKEFIEENEEEFEKLSLQYYSIIKKWNDEHSMISKMFKFVNNSALNDRTLVETERKLSTNKAILDLLLNNRLTILKNIRVVEEEDNSITLDVNIEKKLTRDHRNTSDALKIELIVQPTDSNIEEFRRVVYREMGTDFEENSIFVNRVNLLISILIAKYNRNTTNVPFDLHKTNLFRIKSNNLVSDRENDEIFMRNYKNILIGIINSPSSSIMQMLFGGYYYYSIWDLRRGIGDNVADLDIDYASMSNEHLIMFRDLVTWLINRHARYIGVNEKDRESYCMYLGSNILKGKKDTKEVLTRHLNLSEMNSEIQRRQIG